MSETTSRPLLASGVVLRSTAGFFDVLLPSGDIVRARLRGRLKHVRQNTDLCVIGDQVMIAEGRDGAVTVEEVLPRRTVFSRQHPARGGHREDVLIANLDVLVIVMAYEAPPFVPRMIDRYLVIAEHNGVDAVIVTNKFDLRIEEDDYIDEALTLYESLGYRCVRTCASPLDADDDKADDDDDAVGDEDGDEIAGDEIDGDEIDGDAIDGDEIEVGDGVGGLPDEDPGVLALRELLKGRVSVFSGPSGAGKSSLVNRIEPGLDLRVGATSEAHGKGRHTTRVATLHPLTGGGFIADTPGIRELAGFEIPSAQLASCFREFRPFLGQCQYRSCRHLTEPGCAILSAVESEDIDSDRYESFAKLLLGEERPDRVG